MQLRQPSRQPLLQRRTRRRLDQQLHALHPGHACHAGGHRRVARDRRRRRQGGGGVEKGLCDRGRLRLRAQQRQVDERRQPERTPLGQLLGGEGDEVVPHQRRQQRVRRVPGLDPHLARRSLGGVAAGATGSLHQQREQALGGAKVAREQRAVGVDRRHQRHAPEVVPLGDHLGADQHVDLARVHRRQPRLQRALDACGVGVDAADAGAGQQRGDLLLELLGAAAQRRDIGVAAVRAGARHALGEAAVVAAQRAVGLVEDAPCAAVRAAALPATGAAVQHRRVAAAVEQQQALLAARDALLDRRLQRRRQHRGLRAARARQPVHVEHAHRRQCAASHARGQREPRVAPLLGTLPGLQRRRGRPQDHRHALEPAAVDREVARRVARPLLLLVGRIVLLVDDDQPRPWQRREDRHARAQHEVGAAGQRQQPVAQPLRRRQPAVQADQHPAGEARGEARLELRREVDLGHQHQRLPAGVQRLGGGAQVDLGLARPGDPVQQHRAGRQPLQHGERGRLFAGQRRQPGRRARGRRRRDRTRQPARDRRGIEPAQLGRQHRQRQLADAALVVAGREAHQLAPARRQRRNGVEHLRDRSQRLRGSLPRAVRIPDHARHHAPPERNPHQRAGCQPPRRQIVQQPADRAVLRRLDRHHEPDRIDVD